jgi:integral membrane sensor domain MASE1
MNPKVKSRLIVFTLVIVIFYLLYLFLPMILSLGSNVLYLDFTFVGLLFLIWALVKLYRKKTR